MRARSRSAGGGDEAAGRTAPRVHGGGVPSGHWAPADRTTSAESNAPTTAPQRRSDIRFGRTSRGCSDPARQAVVEYRVPQHAAKLGDRATVAQW